MTSFLTISLILNSLPSLDNDMKKEITFLRPWLSLAVASALLVVSCYRVSPEAAPQQEAEGRTELYISTCQEGEQDETRTELSGGNSVIWLVGDEIAIFSGNAKGRFTSRNTVPTSRALFSGSIALPRDPGSGDDAYVWALYPYSAGATYSSGVVKTSLPASQTAAENTFADDLLPMMGRSLNPFIRENDAPGFGVSAGGTEVSFVVLDGEDGETDPDNSEPTVPESALTVNISFLNICAGLRFTVDRDDIRSITMTATGGESLAGTFTAGFSSAGVPEVRSVSSPANSITLAAPNGSCFRPGVSYYFVTLPAVLSQGVTFTFSTGTLIGTRTISSAFTLKRSKYAWKEHLDKNVAFTPDPNATQAGDFIYGTHSVEYEEDFRGVWIATVKRIGFPLTDGAAAQQAELVDLIRDMKRMGFNAIVFQVNPYADALWDSQLLPWSHFLTGTSGQDPGYDPLQLAIETAHAEGMELHAWFNPYRIGPTDIARASSHPMFSHPTWYETYKDSYYWNPGVPELRTFLGNVMKEVVQNYDVDGTHIDDYFYPSGLQSSTGTWNDTSEYNQYHGSLSLANWRIDNVDKTVRIYQEVTHYTKSHVIFGAAPGANLNYCHSLYCYPNHWLSQGTVDYITPQVYWDHMRTDGADFNTRLNQFLKMDRNPNCPIIVGVAPYMVYDSGSNYYFYGHPEEMLYQKERVEELGLGGMIWFRERYCQKPLLTNYIPDHVYTEEVLTPRISLHPASLPAPVVSVNGTDLSWSAVQGADNYVVLELTRQSSTSAKWDAAIVSSGTGRTFTGTSGHYYIVLARSGSKRSTYSAVIYLP